MEARLAQLERRVTSAEQRESGTRWAAIAVLLATLVFGTARPAATVQAVSTVKSSFRVVDAQGKTLMEVDNAGLGALRGGTLRLFSQRGRPVVVAGADSAGGELQIHGHPGVVVARLRGNEVAGYLDIGDTQGNRGVWLTAEGGGGLGLSDRGTVAAALIARDRAGQLVLYNGEKPSAEIGAGQRGGTLTLRDAAGRLLFA